MKISLSLQTIHPFLVAESLGEHVRETDLIDPNVGVGADDGPGGVVYSLAHHMHSEQALLPLYQLFEAPAECLVSGCIHVPENIRSFKVAGDIIFHFLLTYPQHDQRGFEVLSTQRPIELWCCHLSVSW